jgi:hypothetical protein
MDMFSYVSLVEPGVHFLSGSSEAREQRKIAAMESKIGVVMLLTGLDFRKDHLIESPLLPYL